MQKQDANDPIERGMQTVQLALKVNNEDPETLAIDGSLELLAAEENVDPAKQIEFKNEADRLLTKAISADPFLKTQYGSIQKQAETQR